MEASKNIFDGAVAECYWRTMQKIAAIPIALCAFLFAGCETIYSQRQMEDEQRDTQIQNLRDEVTRLSERVGAVEAIQHDLQDQFVQSKGGAQDSVRALQSKVDDLQHQLQTSDAARASDREQIVNSLSGRVADLMKPRASAPASGSRTEKGYEHVVEPGQTLSAIAAAYKVKAKTIIEANHLKDANSIRVGQKLFIPAE
jgi:LysM repeat protein